MRIITTPALTLCTLAHGADPHRIAEPGEGGEVVVTERIILRDVAPDTRDNLPLVAVGTAKGMHHLHNPNKGAIQGFWTSLFGRLDENGKSLPTSPKT
jgi:hypothetical protein